MIPLRIPFENDSKTWDVVVGTYENKLGSTLSTSNCAIGVYPKPFCVSPLTFASNGSLPAGKNTTRRPLPKTPGSFALNSARSTLSLTKPPADAPPT